MNDFGTLGAIMGVVGALYLVPSFIAVFRKRPNTGTIFGINILLGWTIIGWGVALMWALKGRERGERRRRNRVGAGRKACPECSHSVRQSSRSCRHCGYRFEDVD